MGQPLYERYRPARWEEIIGQADVVKRLRLMESRDTLAGRAYFLTGASGTGKTSIARLIAASVADDFCTVEVDASALTVAQLRELERDSQIRGWGDKPGRAIVVNEAHGLRKDVIRQLLVTLERIPAHCVWVFTTTSSNQQAMFEDCLDASPLLSRCIALSLAVFGLARAFAARALEIGQREGLVASGTLLEQLERNCRDCNFRSLLQAVESGTWA